MLFKVSAAIIFSLAKGNEEANDEINIASCIMNNIHKEDEQKIELEFFGYDVTNSFSISTSTGEPNFCEYAKYTDNKNTESYDI